MKKYILSLAIFAFVLSLLTVSASSARAYECEPGHLFSIFTGQRCGTTSNSDQNFDDLKIGSRGERVRAFQQMLKDGGFLSGKVDGVYGRITDGAAKNYYRIYPPTPINTNAPTISGVSGPQTLNVNQTGTWTVSAYDRNGYDLSYTVLWGDEVFAGTAAAGKPSIYPVPQQSATFTHSYATAGTYKPTFTVTNKYGQSAKTSLSVVVGTVSFPLNYSVTTDKSIYTSDEKITIYITARNDSTNPVTLNFSSGCQTSYAIGSVFDTQNTQGCTAVLSLVSIPAGTSKTWTRTHDPKDYKLSEGNYQIVGRVIGYGSATTNIIVKNSSTNTITVLSPNGGETWAKGTTQTISWQDNTPFPACPTGMACVQGWPSPKYDIYLQATCAGYYCTDVYRPSYTIATNTYGSTYNWSVGKTSDNNTVPDGAYLMKVCHAGTSNCDFSDRYFTISSTTNNQILTVVSPNGGETWVKGTTQMIKWTGVGDTSISGNNNRYDISLISSTGSAYTIANISTTEGSSYSWSVGQTRETSIVPDGLYKVKVFQTGPPANYWDSSDNYFTIVSGTNNQAPTISYLSPTYGPVGTTVTITGSGFATTGNKIRFGNLGVENSPSYNNLSSSDGTHLTFTVPYSNYYACWDSYPACMIAARMTAPGVYPVSVIVNEKLTSNSVDFTVTQ